MIRQGPGADPAMLPAASQTPACTWPRGGRPCGDPATHDVLVTCVDDHCRRIVCCPDCLKQAQAADLWCSKTGTNTPAWIAAVFPLGDAS